MKIAVKDASILIDLIEGGLLDSWFSREIETYATDLVLGELTEQEQSSKIEAYIKSGRLVEVTYEGSSRDRSPQSSRWRP